MADVDDHERRLTKLEGLFSKLQGLDVPNQALDTVSDVTFNSVSVALLGNWTPTLVGTGTAGTFTYTTRVGRYLRIGTRVLIDFNVHISVVTVAATGNLNITGLPYTSINTAGYSVTTTFSADKVVALGTTVQITGRIAANVALIDFIETGNNIAATLLPASAISAGTTINGSCTYEAV